MTTVTYGSSLSYIGNRPWADVVLNPTSTSPSTLKCLADTGADYLQVNQADVVAAGLGALLAGGTAAGVTTAGGTTHTLLMVRGVTVAIEGTKVNVDLLVDTTNSTSPQIAGRQVLIKGLAAIGFDKTDWHYS
jgi:hypothetical protein